MPKKRKSRVSRKRAVAQQEKALEARAKRSRSMRLLGICMVVLGLGLSARYFFDSRHEAELLRLEQSVQKAQRRGDWPQVEVLAREWAELNPGAFEPWDAAAGAALEMRDVPLAVNYLGQIPDTAPVEAFQELGLLQMEGLNLPLESLMTSQKTLGLYPQDEETHRRLLFYYSMTCQRDLLRQEIQRAIESEGDTLATYVYRVAVGWLTFVNGYDVNQRWLASIPGEETFEVAAAVQLGFRQETDEGTAKQTSDQIQRYENAVKQLRETYPGNLELLAAELSLLCEAGDMELVAQGLAAAPPESAEDSRFWRFKGWLHAAQKQWPDAIAAYGEALEIEPFDWLSQTELELALRRNSQPKAAAEMLVRARLGKEINRGIQLSPNMMSLTPESLYADIQRYMRLCGESALAERLNAILPPGASPAKLEQ